MKKNLPIDVQHKFMLLSALGSLLWWACFYVCSANNSLTLLLVKKVFISWNSRWLDILCMYARMYVVCMCTRVPARKVMSQVLTKKWDVLQVSSGCRMYLTINKANNEESIGQNKSIAYSCHRFYPWFDCSLLFLYCVAILRTFLVHTGKFF